MKLFAALTLAFLFSLSNVASAQTAPAPIPQEPALRPQIELDGTGVATLAGSFPRFALPSGIRSSTTGIDVSDSAVLLGVSERLFRHGAVGNFVVGGTSIEPEGGPSDIGLFLHQLFINDESKDVSATLGRTDTATRLIDFPTLRGDDLDEFVNVLDPFSSGSNAEEDRYANVASVQLNSKLSDFVNFHAQHLISNTPGGLGDTGINSYGISFQHEGLPTLQAVETVPLWGLGYERQTIGAAQGGASNVLYGGLVYNIKRSLVNRVDLRAQDIYSWGNSLRSFANPTDTFCAAANSVAVSLRYLNSPFGRPGYQVALTAGYRSFTHVGGGSTFALALTGVKRLGSGFDLVAQYTYQHREPAYAAVFSGVRDEHRIELGFSFTFQNTFNTHLGARRSLLNLQHKYIPD